MKTPSLGDLSLDQLRERFAALALDQDTQLLRGDVAEVNKLNDTIRDIELELRSRPGDQRPVLLALYDHPNPQVRLKAAKATMTVAPEKARHLLQTIAESEEFPQAGHAGMSILGLERGWYKPT